MKFHIAIFVILQTHCTLFSFGQKFHEKIYEINYSNANEYYSLAKHLSIINNRDSLFEAHKILTHLHFFDSTKYSAAFLKSDFLQIEQINFKYYKETIIGKWYFQWSGTNWGTSETKDSKDETVLFTETEVFFYSGDTLKRKTTYAITNKNERFKELFFGISFADNDVFWPISFRIKGADYTAKLKYNDKNLGLYFDEIPLCICGCPMRIYTRKNFTGYIVKQ